MKRTAAASSSFASAVLLAGLLATAIPAGAIPCTGVSVNNATTDDVTLGGADSDGCRISIVNPQQGPDGNTSGFSGLDSFGVGWSLLAKVDGNGVVTDAAGGPPITIGFSETSGTTGTWSVTSGETGVIDLVFAMHASNRSGAFLFDDESLTANLTKSGDWKIEWHNNGGQVPDYSNLTIFYRDPEFRTVPLPGTLALLLGAGLAGAAFRMRRTARS